MNASQIASALENTKLFRGVYSRDNLPKRFKKPAAFIVNTDSQKEPGEHWVVIFVNKNNVEYFDPLGFPPIGKHFFEFVRCHTKRAFLYNCKTIQNPASNKCGNYCIAFVKHKSCRRSLQSFIDKFTSDTIRNDGLLK